MASQHVVEYELHCRRCGYDLRTLGFDGACPECGRPILMTAYEIYEKINQGHVSTARMAGLNKLIEVAARSTYVLDAVLFLWGAHHFVIQAKRQPEDDPVMPSSQDVPAAQLCQAIQDLARIEFGAQASSQLAQWRLATHEQVDELVSLMIQHGVMTSSANAPTDPNARSG